MSDSTGRSRWWEDSGGEGVGMEMEMKGRLEIERRKLRGMNGDD